MRLTSAVAGTAIACAFALTPLAGAHAAGGLEGVPGYTHVGVLVLENESEGSTWGPASVATYLNSLVPGGAFATNYYADGHVSLDNYITMTSGLPGNPDTYSDCLSSNLSQCQASVTAQQAAPTNSTLNIGDQVENAGLTWKQYADSMPSPCFHADLSPTAQPPDPYQGNSSAAPAGNYADRHDGFNYYTDITGNAARCAAHDVPYTQLATDIAANTVPNYFFITPDTCHDGHDGNGTTTPCASGTPQTPCTPGGAAAAASVAGGLVSADCWLSDNLPSLLAYLNANAGVLFITTDEGGSSDTSGCCTGGQGGTITNGMGQTVPVVSGFGGKVGLLALGPGVNAGFTSTNNYDHASLLRTMEDALGIGTHLNNAATATAMADLFSQPSTSTPEFPLSPIVPIAGTALAATVWLRHRARRDAS